ncbi:hypothetical protein CEXT_365541 [Caerostris extrusa]|uniref:Uncharacterized protein n=1 Tax=Caerostris extrusa TaxID=172846 RepID=A0AAV4UYA3_CAEEX|nr:hypothetical protein CEXT_365541 [Caerostris extrusa]
MATKESISKSLISANLPSAAFQHIKCHLYRVFLVIITGQKPVWVQIKAILRQLQWPDLILSPCTAEVNPDSAMSSPKPWGRFSFPPGFFPAIPLDLDYHQHPPSFLRGPFDDLINNL